MAKPAKGKSTRSEKFVLTVRASYPNLDTTSKFEGADTKKYDVTGLIKKSDEAQMKKLKTYVLKTAKEKWGDAVALKDITPPWRDGDDKEDANYEGHYVIVPKTKKKPGVVGPDKQPLDEGTYVYGGCYINISVHAYTYELTKEIEVEKADGSTEIKKKKVKGVTLQLHNVQFLRDGEAFGSTGGPAEDDFEEVDESELGEYFSDVASDDEDEEEVKPKKKAAKKKVEVEEEEEDEDEDF